MSSVAKVKFIKTKVIFRYHTKGVSNQVSSNLDHEIKSLFMFKFSYQNAKKLKSGKNFFGLQNVAIKVS